jgi:hypothetical protein
VKSMASGENEQVRPFVPDIRKRADRLMTALPHRRRFGRLTGPLHPNLLAEILDCLLGLVEGMSGVRIGPDATAFARMPFSASNCASPAVKFWIAPLVVA